MDFSNYDWYISFLTSINKQKNMLLVLQLIQQFNHWIVVEKMQDKHPTNKKE